MKRFAICAAAMLLATMGAAMASAQSAGTVRLPLAGVQAPTDAASIYAAGVSYNVSGSPAVAGTALYAHLLTTTDANGNATSTGTYAFTAIDALPASVHPFAVVTNIGVGVAQKIATVGKVPVYVPAAAGVSWKGTNTGWQWNTGAIASIKIKDGYYLMPSVRLVKSSVSDGSGYQPIIGVLVGWGK